MEIDKKLCESAVNYSVDAIKHICSDIPPREPGSKAEKAAMDYLAADIEKNGWADTVESQPFEVAPKAFMGFSRIIPILIAVGLATFWWLPFMPLICCVAGLTTLFFEFLLYWKFLDPFYPKATSHNLIATKKATGEVKKRIILSGHMDAAYEWTVFYHFGRIVYIGGLVFAIIGAVATIAISIFATVNAAAFAQYKLWLLIIQLVFIPGYLSLFFYSNYKRVVPGANDNLTGSVGAVAVLKYLKEAGIDYQNTEVVCMLAGSEEAGLRGAKAFAKEYKEKLTEGGVQNVFIGLETFRDYDHISIYEKDLSGTVKHSAAAVGLIDKASKPFVNNPLPHASIFLGASDAAAMTQAGIPACTLAAMDPSPAKYYHTRLDTADNLNPECMELGLKISLEAVDIFDKEGL